MITVIMAKTIMLMIMTTIITAQMARPLV